jgi:hypothetical protein
MQEKAIAYYISGHGFGHARRSARIIRRLLELHANLKVHVRTTAAKFLFAALPKDRISLGKVELDSGAAERGPFTVDRARTIQRLRSLLDQAEGMVSHEAEFVRQFRITGIVADVPFLAGEIAHRAGIPAIAAANFTWDWIYEPWLKSEPDGAELMERMGDGYARIGTLLRMPFGGVTQAFQEVHDTPLVACPTDKTREAILASLPPRMGEDRKKVLVGIRGGCGTEMLRRAAAGLPDILLVVPGGPEFEVAPNVLAIAPRNGLDFSDLLSACDGVVSKLGYGILADCCAMGVGIVWPPRVGFREDEVAGPAAAAHMNLSALELDDYCTGNWAPAVRRLMDMPPPLQRLAPTGDQWCARWLGQRWGL